LCENKRSNNSVYPYREKIKFTVLNKTTARNDVKVLNDLVNEIMTEHYLQTIREVKSFILAKKYWETSSISTTHKTFDKLYYPEQLKSRVINKISKFLAEKEVYERFGKNYKLTIILEGIPGTGKTSFVQAVANHFNLCIYHFMQNNQIEDNDLIKNISAIKKENFILFFEDFDKLFIEMDETTTETFGKNTSVSFSTFTNILDGSFSKQGMISFITTNDVSKINGVLKRNGRTDMIEKFDYCDETQTRSTIKHCYLDLGTEELNTLTQNFCKKIKNKKYTISALSQYLFDNKDEPNKILDNIEEFTQLTNQSLYGTSGNGSKMFS